MFWQDKAGPGEEFFFFTPAEEKFQVTPCRGLAPPQTSPPADP